MGPRGGGVSPRPLLDLGFGSPGGTQTAGIVWMKLSDQMRAEINFVMSLVCTYGDALGREGPADKAGPTLPVDPAIPVDPIHGIVPAVAPGSKVPRVMAWTAPVKTRRHLQT